MSETDRAFPSPIFRGDNTRHPIERLPPGPPWRDFSADARRRRGLAFQVASASIQVVNAALLLRRPVLITGRPGTGKSSLPYAVAEELGLGEVLVWPITTRSVLQNGLYAYDAIARLQDASLLQWLSKAEREASRAPDIGRYIRLGALGTALLPSEKPRVVLIDEIDKGDADLPNDLLNVLEDGGFEIPELSRLPSEGPVQSVNVYRQDGQDRVPITKGFVQCKEFPLVFLTSNGEREFPPAFLRRCLRLEVSSPTREELDRIVRAHLSVDKRSAALVNQVVKEFVGLRDDAGPSGTGRELATDQLLNAVFLLAYGGNVTKHEELREVIFKSLSDTVQ